MKRRGFPAVLGIMCIILICRWAWADVQPIPLVEEDCYKCHGDIINLVKEKGGLHKDVACLECHAEHPPQGKDVIPACDMCHASGDSSHYSVTGCTLCHNPHSPREIDFSRIDPAKPACLSCHPEPGREMDSVPSQHAGLDCKECHTEHGQALGCLECHETHTEAMAGTDCVKCHKPHSPTQVVYGDQIPSGFCICCHEDAGSKLSGSTKAHHSMACIECHEGSHTATSTCDACHDSKVHGSYMHDKFPECLTCHRDPHALAE